MRKVPARADGVDALDGPATRGVRNVGQDWEDPPSRVGIRVRWRGVVLPSTDPEHTIVMKLLYGSDQDIEDALGIYVRQRKRLNLRRMREFARRQGALTALRELERKAAG